MSKAVVVSDDSTSIYGEWSYILITVNVCPLRLKLNYYIVLSQAQLMEELSKGPPVNILCL